MKTDEARLRALEIVCDLLRNDAPARVAKLYGTGGDAPAKILAEIHKLYSPLETQRHHARKRGNKHG